MTRKVRIAGLVILATIVGGSELFACGDKFLVGSRGTRYQRPKAARSAAIVIYAAPGEDGTLNARMASMLGRQGHHTTVVTTIDQLSAILKERRFDVVLAATDVAANVQRLFANGATATAVSALITVDAAATPASLLSAVDKAISGSAVQSK